MAEKEQQPGYPLAPANGYSRSDEEAAMATDRELRNQKRKKWALYIIAFIIFQTGIIVLFTMTVMKFRTPKYQVRSTSSFNNFNVLASSFNLNMNAQLGIKNTNFGPYKFESTTIDFFYRGTPVGVATVRKSKANFRSTKKLNIEVDLVSPTSLESNSELVADINSGILPLTATSIVSGKVEIMFIFKKKKSANLNCSMEVNTSTKQLLNLMCK